MGDQAPLRPQLLPLISRGLLNFLQRNCGPDISCKRGGDVSGGEGDGGTEVPQRLPVHYFKVSPLQRGGECLSTEKQHRALGVPRGGRAVRAMGCGHGTAFCPYIESSRLGTERKSAPRDWADVGDGVPHVPGSLDSLTLPCLHVHFFCLA